MSDTTENQNPTTETNSEQVDSGEEKQGSILSGSFESEKNDGAQKPDEGKAEEQKATDQPSESVVPEKYDIKVPEGMSMDTEALERFTPVAKELKLSNDQAQKLADLYAERQEATFKAQREAYAKTVEGWIKEVKADKEIGGTNLPVTQATCKKALSVYDPDGEFMKLMDESGFGNHPAVLRFVNRVGKSVKEDQGVQAKSSAPRERDINKILYGE